MVNTMKFKYIIELKNGYTKTGQETKETVMEFVMDSDCRINANRAIKSMLEGTTNIKRLSAICMDEPCDEINR